MGAATAQHLQDGGPRGAGAGFLGKSAVWPPRLPLCLQSYQWPLAPDFNAAPGDFRGDEESLEEGSRFGAHTGVSGWPVTSHGAMAQHRQQMTPDWPAAGP